ncbi:MAG: hypothetical protein SOZ04_06070 [Bacilli bacterium]|nr:hypothetical protein [Bacilli bacterium]
MSYQRKIINRDKLLSLEVGQKFKSVNKLIEYLEIPYNRNEGEKERVIDYMNEYVRYESTNNSRAKNEIMITWIEDENIFIEPMCEGKLDDLTANAMGYTLLTVLKTNKDFNSNSTFFSKGYLYRTMKMCNANWSELNGDKEKISELAKSIELNELKKMESKDYNSKTLIYEFFDITNSVFNRNLTKGIKWLKNRRLALTSENYAVCINGRHRLATTDEKIALLSCEYNVLTYWHSSYKQVWKNKGFRKFRKAVVDEVKRQIENGNETIPSSLEDIDYYYEVVEFYFDHNNILTEMKKIDTVTQREAKKVSDDNVKTAIDKKTEGMTQRQSKEYKKHMNKLTKDTIKPNK